ncbi:caspase domain-containing protein [Calothrix sp. UHCC 0171]|uniref:caspase domain-containing protein n=1 Tax=Calothrix sp. UHCC 0171 TaxID=3110245 RepID=UPI002B1F4DB1|nr:caspase domain-containing protein [Calothrix sp. UHCC 0171]MEA5572782.1 caspase domain-containing protein [Calothrix sp. UHCC 0171]
MSPLGVGNSHSQNTLQTGEAKLWVLLVGVNQYQDTGLPSLRYPAVDCKGLGEALTIATQRFPQKEVIIHHDFAPVKPIVTTVRQSLQHIVSQTRSQDTILLYFSGHGILEPNTQQAVLCMTDTQKNDLLNTGIPMQELLQILGNSSAHQQLVCLDTCHSGDMVLIGGENPLSRDGENSCFETTSQMLQVLRQRAAQSKGFCALLSCDRGQKSWEFPELGHGVFTYYLMRGLLGEAADAEGIIEADGLYKFVYRQTLQYIDKLNQQLRLINEQKRLRGDSHMQPEYPLQTPKRIVEGVGELIIGFKANVKAFRQPRHALLVDGLSPRSQIISDLSRVLRGAGGFDLESLPHKNQKLSSIRSAMHKCLQTTANQQEIPTTLLYLRGEIAEIEDGEAWLIFADGTRLSRSQLRQELRRATTAQQIVILDCPGATTLENWLEDLQMGSEQSQCIMASASTPQQPDAFSQAILATLTISNPQQGLPLAAWINQLRSHLQPQKVYTHVWLSGTRGVIDILPGCISSIFAPEITGIKPVNEQTTEKKISLADLELQKLELSPQYHFSTFESLDEIALESLFTIGSTQHLQLEKILTKFIGTTAPILIRKTLNQTTNPRQKLEELVSHLLPKQQIEFTTQIYQILPTLILQPQAKDSPEERISPPKLLAENFLQKCDRELINLIGPIGNFIVKEVYKKYPCISPAEFLQKLAKEIPNQQIAAEFLQQFAKEL